MVTLEKIEKESDKAAQKREKYMLAKPSSKATAVSSHFFMSLNSLTCTNRVC